MASPHRVTPFQQRVFRALLEIPAGKVTSYSALAEFLGIRSPRAIGQALKRNPDAPQVPCHRVIAADGRLGGYMGVLHGSLRDRKRDLLAGEGVYFGADGKLANADCWFVFTPRTPCTRPRA